MKRPKRCSECNKIIRYTNKSGYCSNCSIKLGNKKVRKSN